MSDHMTTTYNGVPISYIALVTLSIQNAAAALIMHYSRVMPGYEDKRYFSSTAVLLSEVFKLLCALTIVRRNHVRDNSNGHSPSWISTIQSLITSDSWKLIIPAALYTVQNNLQYLAMSKLDAATFQVTCQLKLLTTALFSVIILRKQLTLTRWGALIILTFDFCQAVVHQQYRLDDKCLRQIDWIIRVKRQAMNFLVIVSPKEAARLLPSIREQSNPKVTLYQYSARIFSEQPDLVREQALMLGQTEIEFSQRQYVQLMVAAGSLYFNKYSEETELVR